MLGVGGRVRLRSRFVWGSHQGAHPTLPLFLHLTPNQVPTDFMDDAAPGAAPVAAPVIPGEVAGRGPVIPGEVPSRGPAMVLPLITSPHPATVPPASSRPGVVRYLP